jgi:hypothetical protein
MSLPLPVFYPFPSPGDNRIALLRLVQSVDDCPGVPVGVMENHPHHFLKFDWISRTLMGPHEECEFEPLRDIKIMALPGNPFQAEKGSTINIVIKPGSDDQCYDACVKDAKGQFHYVWIKVVNDEVRPAKKSRTNLKLLKIDGKQLSRKETIRIFMAWCEHHNEILALQHGHVTEKFVWMNEADAYRSASGKQGKLTNFVRYDMVTGKAVACENVTVAIEAMEKLTNLSFYEDVNDNMDKYDVRNILTNAGD